MDHSSGKENERKKLMSSEKEFDFLSLSLPFNRPQPQPILAPCASTLTSIDLNSEPKDDLDTVTVPSRSRPNRRPPSQGPGEGKSMTVPPPFPWATNHRATVYDRTHLLKNNIRTITGTVQCKRCDKKFEMGFDLEEKFTALGIFIQKNKATMHDRAPKVWVDPVLPMCQHCGQENCVKPVLGNTKKKAINWLFLLLGQMLGCCTLNQLKYFCKHTKNHRTGAKDRVLYSTYMGLFKQLAPEWSLS
ncbi:uncharacterized protein LOC113866321 [Abrus precatorius]|uniref:Uncharacterized protein LOC113866321 n=1 Tax=Abrus precatorius TaxID=3816 RepID=A0A8B8LQ54_ABRPR|nr:uncharacterized protein LOC113866321 [Abrus precatorius]